jgi:hypothetical protein
MNNKFFWKVWLRLNLLTKDVDNDYVAEVSTTGKNSIRNEDIARLIVESGSEIKYDTLLNILNQNDRIIREQLQQGHSVLTGVSHYSPRVLGSWIGANAKYNPEVNKLTVEMTPSAALRAALAEVGVEVLGVKDSGAYIGMVTDAATGLTNGSITPGDDIIIEGAKMKIAPDGEDGLGVFYVSVATGEPVPTTRRLTQNDPAKIIARVPDLPPGEYILRIVTRFSNSAILLKEQRIIEYAKRLIVE